MYVVSPSPTTAFSSVDGITSSVFVDGSAVRTQWSVIASTS